MHLFAAITPSAIYDGLLSYVCLIIVLTFHEYAHAWTASKCGDDTARLLGRVSLNPVVHMEVVGTVVLPLLMIFLSAANSQLANFIIGWGKPVPVNPYKLRRRRTDDTLVALAGPAMNLLLAFAAVVLARGFTALGVEGGVEVAIRLTIISLVLCFFNLLPIPPLDGSHVLKNLIGMSDATYLRLGQFGFILVILVLQVPPVRWLLGFMTQITFVSMGRAVGLV